MLSIEKQDNFKSNDHTTENESLKKENSINSAFITPLPKKYAIGGFSIEHKIGQGGFGKVFLATHILTQEQVAMKIINKAIMKDEKELRRVENEIIIHKKLYHESIIRYFCVLETQSTISMITEYCPNGDLFNYLINKQRLNEKDACYLFQQLISGIYYLHQQSIVHRDIKLDNLLLSSNNHLKIADFGLSKITSSTLSTLCGSPCYLAPELLAGNEYSGEAVDVWCCGIVLYAMLVGQLPFYDDNKDILFNKIKNGDYTIPSYITEPCIFLLKELLNINPAKRITITEIYHHPWFNFLNCNINNIVSPGLFLDQDIIPIDNDLLEEIVNHYYYKKAEGIQSILLNKHNDYTLVYYLCLQRKIRNNHESISDISSSSKEFLNYIKSNRSKNVRYSNIDKVIEFNIKSISKKISVKQRQKPVSNTLSDRGKEISNIETRQRKAVNIDEKKSQNIGTEVKTKKYVHTKIIQHKCIDTKASSHLSNTEGFSNENMNRNVNMRKEIITPISKNNLVNITFEEKLRRPNQFVARRQNTKKNVSNKVSQLAQFEKHINEKRTVNAFSYQNGNKGSPLSSLQQTKRLNTSIIRIQRRVNNDSFEIGKLIENVNKDHSKGPNQLLKGLLIKKKKK